MTPPIQRIGPPAIVPLTDILASLSFALDLTEGQPMGHSLRTNLIAMELATRLDLPLPIRRDLYHAALLKDAGCSSNASAVFEMFAGNQVVAKRERMMTDWPSDLRGAIYAFEHAAPGASWFERCKRVASIARLGQKSATRLVQVRCDRGADIVIQLGFGPGAAEAVRTLEEHWDGHGHPSGLKGEQIPLAARVLGLAQILDVFTAEGGPYAGLDLVRRRSGKWFDPQVVEASREMAPLLARWSSMTTHDLRAEVTRAEPGLATMLAGTVTVRHIANVFAGIVDAKSPFTAAHSHRVAELSVGVSRGLGWSLERIEETCSAALLHDIGKLSVPNSILDKPGALAPGEWEIMRMHALYTERILEQVKGFEWLAFASAAHHERMDGSGYCRGLEGEQVPDLARVLAVADVYDALSTARPYRHALEPAEVFVLMERDGGKGFSRDCLDALKSIVEAGLDGGESDVAQAA